MVGIMRGPARPRRAAWIRSVPLADGVVVRLRHCGELSACALVHTDVQLAPEGIAGKETMKSPDGTEAKSCKRFALGAGPIGDPQSPGPIKSGAIKGYMPDRCLRGIRHPRRHLDTTPLRSPASRYPQALCGRAPLQSLLQAFRLLEGEAVCLREDGGGIAFVSELCGLAGHRNGREVCGRQPTLPSGRHRARPHRLVSEHISFIAWFPTTIIGLARATGLLAT
jgi:hypothetical protein